MDNNSTLTTGGGAQVALNQVGGNVEISGNRGLNIVSNNKIGGNVQVNGNFTFEEVSTNIIGGNLSCTGNTPSSGITCRNGATPAGALGRAVKGPVAPVMNDSGKKAGSQRGRWDP